MVKNLTSEKPDAPPKFETRFFEALIRRIGGTEFGQNIQLNTSPQRVVFKKRISCLFVDFAKLPNQIYDLPLHFDSEFCLVCIGLLQRMGGTL